VVVVEISQGVMQAAPLFEPYNRATLRSPKLRVVRSDAYRALLRDPQRYDVIVSAPSNLWITGIELLYTVEFFEAGRDRLAPGGVYAQWIHAYDSDEETLALVLRTFREAFGKTSVWYSRGPDLILLGFEDEAASVDLDGLLRRWERADVQAEFARIGVRSTVELLAHELLPLDVVARAELSGPLNSIANPILGHRAARAFFEGRLALLPETHHGPAAAAGSRNSLLRRYAARSGGSLSEGDRWSAIEETCRYRRDQCATLFAAWRRQNPDSAGLRELSGAAARNRWTASVVSSEVQDLLAFLLGGSPPPGAPSSYESVRSAAAAARRHHHHAVPFPEDQLRRLWLGCSDDPRCEARLNELDAAASATASPG
jgi:hypothetical protein